ARLAKEAKPLVQVRGRWVSIDRADLASAAAALAARAAYTQLTGAELLRHAMGLEGALLGGPLQVEGTGWAVELLRGATTNPPAPLEATAGFVGKLRHYQAEAAGWLAFLERSRLGGCLAMDMGLGKTPTVLAHLLADKGGGPTLVICPPAVLTNWRAEAARFTPKLRVTVHHGPRRADPAELAALAAGSDVILTTFGTALRDMDHLSKVAWKRVVVDEAQAIKNHNSDTARSLRRLGAGTRLALTGTPVENGLGDLWSILDFVNPGLVGGRTEFVEKLSRRDVSDAGSAGGSAAGSAGGSAAGSVAGDGSQSNGGVANGGQANGGQANGGQANGGQANGGQANGGQANGGANGSQANGGAADGSSTALKPAEGREEGALRALNGLLVFRRTKSEPEIAAELPDKVDKLDSCAMTSEQVGLYQAVLDRLIEGGLDEDATRRRGQVLAAITALKQVCDHPEAYLKGEDNKPLAGRSGKLARLEEILTDVFAAGERVLIFTHFARWGERLAGYLTERFALTIPCYHGGLARNVRDRMIADFQGGRGPGALVLSIKAGGSGLNLTAANHVVLYDRWWNPAVEDQARDRAWRLGQASTVVSHRMVCPGTVDERVEEIVAGKRRVAGLVLPARSSLGDLDAEQLRAALGLEAEQLIDEEPIRDLPTDEEAA
ncbi:MAG: DEAD/DEAH box helicase, partial [Acidimicrobiales bacterium]